MATKRSKPVATATTPKQTAQQIWLAGLGAASIAQKRGGDVLARLVAEGKTVQTRGGKLARELGPDIDELTTRVTALSRQLKAR